MPPCLKAPRPQSSAKNLIRRSSSDAVCCTAFWRAATAAADKVDEDAAGVFLDADCCCCVCADLGVVAPPDEVVGRPDNDGERDATAATLAVFEMTVAIFGLGRAIFIKIGMFLRHFLV